MEYQKIQTLFKRDSDKVIIPTEYTLPEFKFLENCVFECTEKIDGMNMRVEVDNKIGTVEYKGRTDKAVIPNHLYKYMCDKFPKDKILKMFSTSDKVTIFGEGYGVRIQNGGNYISDGVAFILFDVKIGDWWLNRDKCESIAKNIGVNIVPVIGYMTIKEAVDFVSKGFKSTISENKDYNAEGLVLRTPNGLRFRNGERIIAKIKTRDFVQYNNKYNK